MIVKQERNVMITKQLVSKIQGKVAAVMQPILANAANMVKNVAK